MRKEEFLQELANELSELNDAERARAIDYFHEIICDGIENGEDEQEVIEKLGSVKSVAAQILSEKQASTTGANTDSSHNNNSNGNQNYQQSNNYSQNNYQGSAFVSRGDLQKIVVEAQHTYISVVPVQGNQVHVIYEPGESDYIDCHEANGVFSFCQRVRFSFFSWTDLFWKSHRIVVEIPEKFDGIVEIKTSNAKLNMNGFPYLASVKLVTSNAHISFTDSVCKIVDAHTSNGTIDLRNLTGESCNAKTNNARISADDCKFINRFSLATQNGTICADRIISDSIEYYTSNASVNSNILGDMREYAVYSHTSNASNNLPPELAYPDQKKRLNVKTSNGKIDVRFHF